MQNNAVSMMPAIRRVKSNPELSAACAAPAKPVDLFFPPSRKVAPPPLCSKKTASHLRDACAEAVEKHDSFRLGEGVARGAMIAQLVGMSLTLSGLLGGWALAVVGAGIITLTVAACLAFYLIQRRGKAGAAERKIVAMPLRHHLEGLQERLKDKAAVKAADPDDLRRARVAVKALQETLAMLDGGPWYVTKSLVSRTVIGSLFEGIELAGRTLKRFSGGSR